MKTFYLLISMSLLQIVSFAQQQKTKKWYVKMELGYGLGIKAYSYSYKGEIIKHPDYSFDYSKNKFFGIFPGRGSQVCIKIGKKFNNPIGIELGISYHRCHRYDYSLTNYNADKDGFISYSSKANTQYYGFALTASPTLVFRKNTAWGVFYTSMGFSIGLGQWVRVGSSDYSNFELSEFKFPKHKYMMGFHFGLGLEKPITNSFSLCSDLRLNNLFYYYSNYEQLKNSSNYKAINKQIPFSNLALNLGLMYHF